MSVVIPGKLASASATRNPAIIILLDTRCPGYDGGKAPDLFRELWFQDRFGESAETSANRLTRRSRARVRRQVRSDAKLANARKGCGHKSQNNQGRQPTA